MNVLCEMTDSFSTVPGGSVDSLGVGTHFMGLAPVPAGRNGCQLSAKGANSRGGSAHVAGRHEYGLGLAEGFETLRSVLATDTGVLVTTER